VDDRRLRLMASHRQEEKKTFKKKRKKIKIKTQNNKILLNFANISVNGLMWYHQYLCQYSLVKID